MGSCPVGWVIEREKEPSAIEPRNHTADCVFYGDAPAEHWGGGAAEEFDTCY